MELDRSYRIKLTFERDCGLRFACERGGGGGSCLLLGRVGEVPRLLWLHWEIVLVVLQNTAPSRLPQMSLANSKPSIDSL